MFHTFGDFEDAKVPKGATTRAETERSQRRSLHACTSCRRRKIRCNGEKPCEACRWYKTDQCHYGNRLPSWGQFERLSSSLNEHRGILHTLFPDCYPESLVGLSREELLELAAKKTINFHGDSTHLVYPSLSLSPSQLCDKDPNLEYLQSMPESPSRRSNSSDMGEDISDDVNGLRLFANDTSSTYLGVSSIQAAFKVIDWLDPDCVASFRRPTGRVPDNLVQQQEQAHHALPTEMESLDAYFVYFQPFTPLIDETSFREAYLAGGRKDAHWLALLNVVLALGSIAISDPHDHTHREYFAHCKKYSSLNALGSSHLETIQTLGLLGGWYYHYVSQPNLAWPLLGTALRMAVSLGMHKEPIGPTPSTDLRRRVWWSLICMDTWASTTLGRPSMGRFSSTITIKPPCCPESITPLEALPLAESIRFAKIATEIQECLAASPLIKHQESLTLDKRLVEWWDDLPDIFKNDEPCTESIATVRTVMRWRFYNQRMLLYRPMLLSYAMRRVPYNALRSDECTAIESCRRVADLSVQDFVATVVSNQLCGWNAVWFTFQVALVPLIGLFLNDLTAGTKDPRASFESCQAQVEMAIMVLQRLKSYGHKAERSLDVVSRLFEASKRRRYTEAQDAEGLGLDGIVADHATSESLGMPFVDDINDEYLLWEYLSWSNDNFWHGIAEFDGKS